MGSAAGSGAVSGVQGAGIGNTVGANAVNGVAKSQVAAMLGTSGGGAAAGGNLAAGGQAVTGGATAGGATSGALMSALVKGGTEYLKSRQAGEDDDRPLAVWGRNVDDDGGVASTDPAFNFQTKFTDAFKRPGLMQGAT